MKTAKKCLPPMPEGVCYGWDDVAKHVIRFRTGYQRHLWISNGHPEFPDDRRELDEAHHLVRSVKMWSYYECGYDVGTP